MIRKFISTLNDFLNDFCHTIDEEYNCTYGGEGFSVDLDENLIYWTLVCDAKGAEAFYSNFCARYPVANKFSLLFCSILHEIGHLETEDEAIDDTKEREFIFSDTEYFNLWNEILATDWAGIYLTDNTETALEIDNKLLKMLDNFYKNILDKE